MLRILLELKLALSNCHLQGDTVDKNIVANSSKFWTNFLTMIKLRIIVGIGIPGRMTETKRQPTGGEIAPVLA